MKIKTRIALTLIALSAFAALIIINWDEIGEVGNLLSQLSISILLPGVILIQLFSYFANAKFYQTFYVAFGAKVDLKKLYEVSLALNFVNQVIPTLGASGVSYLSYALKEDAPKGQSAFGQISRYVLTYITFIALLVVGGLALFFGGSINQVIVRIVVLLIFGIIAVSILIVYIIINRKRMNQALHWTVSVIDWAAKKFRKNKENLIGKERLENLLDEFHGSFEELWRHKLKLIKPIWYAFLGNVAEVATVYVVFVAFGQYVNPGAVFIGYALANLGGLITIIPGSVGIYESIMVTVFSATGLPVALSLSTTLVYRVTNMGIFVPLGFVMYERVNTRLQKSKDTKLEASDG